MYVSMIRLCILWEADKSVRDELSKSFLGNDFTWVDVMLIILRSHLSTPVFPPYRVQGRTWVLIVTHITPGTSTVVSNTTLSFFGH